MSIPWLGGLFGNVYAGRRVLVTGHTGFKGSWLAYWLHAMGARVFGLALPPDAEPAHLPLLGLQLEEALVDLRDAAAVTDAVRRFEPEVVFHLAAQPLVRRSYREPRATFDTNVMGLVNLLEAVRAMPSVRVVVNATTDKCYQNLNTPRGYQEGDALGGHDPYSASKACAEIVSASYRASFLAQDEGRGHAVALATARAGNVIGGGDWSEDRLIPDLARAAMQGRVTAIRHPGATRPWQHVLEPLSGYLLLGQRLLADPAACAEAWNFGPDAEGHLSVGEVVSRFADAWPAVQHQLDSAPQPHEAALLHLDCRKAHDRLGWRPVWEAGTMLARTAAWYRGWHDSGRVATCHDLQQYVADARRAGLEWASR
ncbi:CDP-glucose 4,6-dehydratase [Caldimonas brevitalea]|uniref:CDP-glucose 4,6-dehydratase n=1 Tax=Caldimonas brevitalea TaxID=413882 RepID=A0A0G3BNH3_9BURK|nr:CDP-glucose 4,6-dehydratase [Caldimonas brevitalea]AKJ30999.1 CDP-glucose 4,6-dehydratase [Caldimonas brevitalea]